MESPTSTYPQITKILHTSLIALIVIEFFTALVAPQLSGGMSPGAIVSLHFSFGLVILPLAAALIGMRYAAGNEGPGSDPLTQLVANVGHYALYALLIITPFAGLLWADSRGWEVSLFGFIALPAIVGVGSGIGRIFGELHAFFAAIIGLLALGHIAGALYSRFIASSLGQYVGNNSSPQGEQG